MDVGDWGAANERFLDRGLHWLRLRLRQLIGEDIAEADVARARAEMSAPSAPPFPALVALSRRLELTPVETGILLACVGMETDPTVPELCARANGSVQLPFPTFALALSLFEHPSWEVTLPSSPLRYWRLIELGDRNQSPLLTGALRGDERIINHIRGLDYLDDRLANLVLPLTTFAIALPPSQAVIVERAVRLFRQENGGAQLPILQLAGADCDSKQAIAGRIATKLGVQLYRLPEEYLPNSMVELETFVRLWARECLLQPVGLYVETQENHRSSSESVPSPLALRRFLQRDRGILFLDVREPKPDLDRASVTLEVVKPTVSEQEAAWKSHLDAIALPESPQRLATQFDLDPVAIARNARLAKLEADADPEHTHACLWQACLTDARSQLGNLAQRIDVKACWEDIVLPETAMNLLRQISNQMQWRRQVYEQWGFYRRMNRGLGVSALFAGESGTGKTMAAEVIAASLQLDLYRIDLSAVVSKYIGETEKNLSKLFDAAENGSAILFFDEADALFGKRGEVRDSHDRYANIETNYLLQRLESFRGLAILATNLKNSMEKAFLRRLRFVVEFPVPGQVERQRIWERAFPPETPTRELDCEQLSQWDLTGGNIANIALNAAFLAAAARSPVTMALVEAAAKAEYKKLDRPIRELIVFAGDRER